MLGRKFFHAALSANILDDNKKYIVAIFNILVENKKYIAENICKECGVGKRRVR